jgi:hypothetical protein
LRGRGKLGILLAAHTSQARDAILKRLAMAIAKSANVLLPPLPQPIADFRTLPEVAGPAPRRAALVMGRQSKIEAAVIPSALMTVSVARFPTNVSIRR